MIDHETQPASPRAGIDPEAPELGRPGEWPIGTQTFALPIGSRPVLTFESMMRGECQLLPQTLSIRIWYPAAAQAAGALARYEHGMTLLGEPPVVIGIAGRAMVDAEAAANQRFPLVVLSHGFGGWNTQFSRLGEHLASRGYVVASIDHSDQPAASLPEFMLSFGNVLINRTLDQRAVIAELIAAARGRRLGLPASADTGSIALIGYSMGGYGALNTAGAPYSFANEPSDKLPPGAREQMEAAPAAALAALVLFAPWGGQPQNRAWTEAGLAKVCLPTLVVSGSQDDVVDHNHGVRWLFDSLTSSNRHLLTYREARHNIVGDPFDLAGLPFAACEFLAEPVWRRARLNAINQHFVTAFLDRHLKHEPGKSRYLDVPCTDANQGDWPLPLGAMLGGALSGRDQPGYWPGFPRRWAAGVELESRSAGA